MISLTGTAVKAPGCPTGGLPPDWRNMDPKPLMLAGFPDAGLEDIYATVRSLKRDAWVMHAFALYYILNATETQLVLELNRRQFSRDRAQRAQMRLGDDE